MRPLLAVVLGLFLGALPALVICVAIRAVAQQSNRPRGTVHPVMVAVRALPTGAAVTMNDVAQRSIPEELITSSLVKPDSASYVINQVLAVPLASGDPLPWAAFDTMPTIEGKRPALELVEACAAEMARRNVEGAPPTVAGLRAAVLGAAR